MNKIITVAIAVGLLGVAAPASARDVGDCTTVRDHITKTDSGHGTPAEWADLSLSRVTKVCQTDGGYDVTLNDRGLLWTRVGAGTPNGTGGQIAHRVRGTVNGVYYLTVTGGTLANRHGDVTKASTDYVRSLFSDDATVTGGAYNWTYRTRCEKWVDASSNGDGQGEHAGNITGKRCAKPSPSPTPTPTDSTTPSPTPTTSTPPGEAPVPKPVPGDLGVTG